MTCFFVVLAPLMTCFFIVLVPTHVCVQRSVLVVKDEKQDEKQLRWEATSTNVFEPSLKILYFALGAKTKL